MVKSHSISWLLIGIFLFSILFQLNYNEQIQTNLQNTPDSIQQKPISLGNDLEQGAPTNEKKKTSLNPLGEIEISHLYFTQEMKDPTSDYFFPSSSPFITYSHYDPIFLGTIANASAERSTEGEDPRSSDVKFQISETIIWKYSEFTTNYIVGFTPVLQKAFLDKMYFNGTELDPSDYIENSTGTGSNKTYSFYYDFEDVFNEHNNGEFNLTYVYNMVFPITQWSVTNVEPNQFITQTNQTITQKFSYNVTLGGGDSKINTLARFKIYLPNHQDIFNPILDKYNNETLSSNQYDLKDNILSFTNATYLNETNSLDLTFQTNFTVEMLETVEGLWCEDRLVEGLNLRERDYKITISEGPADLILKNVGINETGIYYDNLQYRGGDSGRSALKRNVFIENMNKSTGNENIDINDTSARVEYVDGISFLHGVNNTMVESYWLTKDEVDIITISYYAVFNLSIVLMDKISNPIKGYSVKLYIGSQLFGTSVNNFTTIPYPMLKSDKNGEIFFYSIPVANYTIDIYNKFGKFIENATVTPLEEQNFVVTSVPHYPLTILVYSGVGIALILVGYVIFKKNS
ncbi:MAG: hypothetical protein ACTSWX_04590 [Promethearchaeota archaeon]